jgi:hypothetical protein
MPDQEINLDHHLTRVFLRYFREGGAASVGIPAIDRAYDADYLRLHWAFSSQVSSLARYVFQNRHEAQASLDRIERVDDAVIRGTLSPAKTVIRREITGHPSLVVCSEPLKTYSGGANHVLIWVIQHAFLILSGMRGSVPQQSGYFERLTSTHLLLDKARRIGVIEQALRSTDLRVRPAINSLRQAGMSRRMLYRKAFAAYDLLHSVESGNGSRIGAMLQDTLIGPLKHWQRFELLLAFGMAQSLAKELQATLVLLPIAAGGGPILRVGNFDFYWQSKTDLYIEPQAEPSEKHVESILEAYGINVGSDRPDVVVVDREMGKVVSVGEAKYFGEGMGERENVFRDATAQIVRYCRGYGLTQQDTSILPQCVIALSQLPSHITEASIPLSAPFAVCLDGIIQGQLDAWAQRLVPQRP